MGDDVFFIDICLLVWGFDFFERDGYGCFCVVENCYYVFCDGVCEFVFLSVGFVGLEFDDDMWYCFIFLSFWSVFCLVGEIVG